MCDRGDFEKPQNTGKKGGDQPAQGGRSEGLINENKQEEFFRKTRNGFSGKHGKKNLLFFWFRGEVVFFK